MEGGLHMGTMERCEQYIGSYFESKVTVADLIRRAHIVQLVYEPDKRYVSTQGREGRCWVAYLDRYQSTRWICGYKISFRNFTDLRYYFEHHHDMEFIYSPHLK